MSDEPVVTNDEHRQRLQKKQIIQRKLLLLKLQRTEELNRSLRESLARERIYVSNASYSIINYVTSQKDYVLPEIWGYLEPGQNPFRANPRMNGRSNSDEEGMAGCCTIV